MNELMMLLMGGTGLGNLMGQIGNLGAQRMNMADSAFDWVRYFQRNSDPTVNDLRSYFVNLFNEDPSGPYGDVEGSFGNMWGTRTDGSPVAFGDMAAAQTNYMLENNPVNAALDQLNRAHGMRRPQGPSFDALASGDASVAGGEAYRPRPTSISTMAPVMTSTQMSGVQPPARPNPTISAPSPGVGTNVRQTMSDIRGGQGGQVRLPSGDTPRLPAGGDGLQLFRRLGGVPGLLQSAANYSGGYGTGNFMRNWLRDQLNAA